MIRDIADYFQQTKDPETTVFIVKDSPNQDSPYSGPRSFQEGKNAIHIVDQFNGRRPFVLNNQTCYPGHFTFEIFPSVILDSHVAFHLHSYLSVPNPTNPSMHTCTHSFLNHLVETGYDYNPIFYIIESYRKSSEEDFWRNTPPVIESILKLQSMDSDYFKEKSSVRIDARLEEELFHKYEATSFSECSRKLVGRIQSNLPTVDPVSLTYACLIKMVLIKHKDKKGVIDKLERFESFMTDQLGLRLAYEHNLALYYFANLAGRFVNIQPNMKLTKAISSAYSTAWDLFLLRLPMDLLTVSNLPEISMGYIASCEHKLIEFGQLMTIDAKFCYSKTNEVNQPVFNFDLSEIQKEIGEAATSKIEKQSRSILLERAARTHSDIITEYDLQCLTKDLEIQLSNLCRS
ncbi:hypothetical protein [Pseudodesulfovibrio sp.]|uniref:hypothetical protein n=1 Tax=unclassified Pseudodesulfovibrio TaxID=2661612 RepID=UPI003B002B10